MADIRFYHMEQTTLDRALPMILTKAYGSGQKILIRVPDKKEANRLNDLLWTFKDDSFLPHGLASDDRASQHPILITTEQDNVNDAGILILTHGCTHDDVGSFNMVCEMLDGRVQSQIADARTRWKSYKEANHDLTYWQQDDNGKWGKKA